MKKIQYNVVERDTRNASGKAKNDVTNILSQMGYEKMYNPSKKRWIRVIQQVLSIIKLSSETILFVQYPANIDLCYRILGLKKNVKKIAIIHDLESLRNEKTCKQEKKLLKCFDIVISHNEKMTRYLKSLGITCKIVELNIFDYLLDDSIVPSAIHNKYEIFFAGNLTKSKFIFKLNELKKFKFNIYGLKINGIDELERYSNITYKGSYSSEQLISNLEGGWGLVWDGDSIETCSGISGEYMRYNCPHKVSMCIASEKPVIIWNKSAMAEFVTKNKLGIAVDSLKNVENIISKISEDEYKDILNNVKVKAKTLRKGDNLKLVVQRVE